MQYVTNGSVSVTFVARGSRKPCVGCEMSRYYGITVLRYNGYHGITVLRYDKMLRIDYFHLERYYF
jgi:hypothetical protein